MKVSVETKLRAYAVGTWVFISFTALALFVPKWRLWGLAAAVVSLGFLWCVERLFSRNRPKVKMGRHWHEFGTISIDGDILVGDKTDMSNSIALQELPRSQYSVRVEAFSDGHDTYVAAITLTGHSEWLRPKEQSTALFVDTGFLILVGTSKTKYLAERIAAAQSAILNDNSREIDVELLNLEDRSIGIICSSGYGDGEYSISVSTNKMRKPLISVRFIGK